MLQSLVLGAMLLPVGLIAISDFWRLKKYLGVLVVSLSGMLVSLAGLVVLVYIELFVERHDYGMLWGQRILPGVYLGLFWLTFMIFMVRSVREGRRQRRRG